MKHPRATVCCGEVLCATCAREAIETQGGPSVRFVCPFCGAALGASKRRAIEQTLIQFGEEDYLELLGISHGDRASRAACWSHCSPGALRLALYMGFPTKG